MTSTVHLVCGFLGAGKTKFSSALAERCGAVRFSIDELYLKLFTDGSPTYDLDQAALDRLLDTLHDVWPQICARGVDVVLDFGFWKRALRDQVRTLAAANGAQSRLYWLSCPDEVALERCLRRNGEKGTFLISADGYRELAGHFEPPGSDEMYDLVASEGDRPAP